MAVIYTKLNYFMKRDQHLINNNVLELTDDIIDDSQDIDEMEFEEHIKNRKSKNSKRLDFDEMSNQIIKDIQNKRKGDKSESMCETEIKNMNSTEAKQKPNIGNMMSSMFSKETAATGYGKSVGDANIKKMPGKTIESIWEINEWEEDFMAKPKKQKKPNNLLKLLSNEDFNNIKNTIINDFEKGKQRNLALQESQSDTSRAKFEEEKWRIETVEDERIYEMDDEEEVITNIWDDIPLSGNIFHPYVEKNTHVRRYADDEDES